MREKGLLLALLTAVISGVSIFVNSFAVSFGDPFVHTTVKNTAVAVFVLSLVLALGEWKGIFRLGRKSLAMLMLIGIFGGGIPFLLFFYGLSISSAASASFFYRMLFVAAIAIGVAYFRERLTLQALAGAIVAMAGSYLIAGGLSFGMGEMLVLLAAVMWAGEYALSKRMLSEIPVKTVVLFRMGIGSLVLISFLLLTGGISLIAEISLVQAGWALVSSAFLIMFVFAWYGALRHAQLSTATAALTLGGPITSILSLIFLGKGLALAQATGLLLLVSGIFMIIGLRSMADLLRLLADKANRAVHSTARVAGPK